ncbi:putative P450 monooxygenase [Paecilomyces variotii No. 5]|uniref:Putative P450 monooxygenase n=1 Tax=Byssochlamys spectabilis (strain No. 5 / NBRC 109023) TaxID=1356009 RepID=V5HUY6_BYSSN|nr:putative P450 monooxygenase [Paecilomyces variotii No. 5]
MFNFPSRIVSVFRSKSWIDDGYQLYSRENRPFMVPSLLEEPSLVVLPPSMTSELILAKEAELSFWNALDDIVFSEHAFYSPRILSLPLQTTIIRRHLSSGAQRFMPDMVDQLRNTLDREWGSEKPKQWKCVNLFKSLLNVVNGLVSVVFVGSDLANDREFQTSINKHTEQVFVTMSALRFVPRKLKSWASPFIRRRQDKYRIEVERKLMPLIIDRMNNYTEIKEGSSKSQDKPDDLLQWLIDCQASLKDPAERAIELEPSMIVTRVLMSYFVSVFLVNVALFNAVSIMGQLDEANYWPVIYNEAHNVLYADQCGWTKEKIDKLWKTDSFVKETMRFVGDACFEMRRKRLKQSTNSFLSRLSLTQVMAPTGINLSDGTHLPFGTTVGLPSYAIHHDDRFYPQAARFDGLRFVKLRENEDANIARGSLLTATSNTFLQFGHGRHGCPGRFLATDILKLILAEITLRFEIRWDEKPEKNSWFGNSLLPGQNTVVSVSPRDLQ